MEARTLDATTRRRLHRSGWTRGSKPGRCDLADADYALGLCRAEGVPRSRRGDGRRLGRHCLATQRAADLDGTTLGRRPRGRPPRHGHGESSLFLPASSASRSTRSGICCAARARIRHRGSRLNIRQTRTTTPTDRAPGPGVPRTRNAIAAIRAALWANGRQASLLLTMAVQQGLATLGEIGVELLGSGATVAERWSTRLSSTRWHPVAQRWTCSACGSAGSQLIVSPFAGPRPAPTTWTSVVAVEGGAQGRRDPACLGGSSSATRCGNSIALTGDVVLRLPVLGLRTCPDDFFDQIIEALESAGCQDVTRRGRSHSQVGTDVRAGSAPLRSPPRSPGRRSSAALPD